MTSFRIRPRFRYTTDSCPEQVKKEMEQKIKDTHQSFTSQCVQGHLIVKIKKEYQHYWSPQLDIVFSKQEEGNTLIRGLYGPNPAIWTLFIFLYSSIILSISFLAIYEGCQYNLGMIDSFSWTIPILLAIGVFLYFVSQFGQKLGAEQTFAIHHLLEDTLHEHIEIE